MMLRSKNVFEFFLVPALLHKLQNVQVCDATEAQACTTAGYQQKKNKAFKEPLKNV